MSTAVIPDLATGGDSSTSGSLNASIDSLDLSSLSDDSGVSLPDDISIPDTMVVGGKKRTEGEAPPETAEAKAARDASGKFAKKEVNEAADPDAPAVDAKPIPFRYRAMGNTHELEGSTIDADGNTVIPAAHFEQLREAFASMHQLRTEYGPAVERYKTETIQLRAALKEASEDRGVRETQAEALVNGLSQLMEIAEPSERLQALWDFSQTLPGAKKEAEVKYWREKAERAAQPAPTNTATQPTQGDASGKLTTMPPADTIRNFAKEYLETWKTNPQLRDVPAEAWGQVEKRLAETPFAFMRQATAEHAKAHAQDGINEGDLVFDRDLLFAPIQEHIATSQQTAEQREAERKRIELATNNSRRTQSSITAPPTPGGGKAPASTAKGPSTKKELEDWWESSEL